MMLKAAFWLALSTPLLQAFAQEQLAVRVSDKGLLKIMEMTVKYASGGVAGKRYIIPRDLYSFKISKKDLLSNPIIPVLNEVSNINLTRDLPFYLETSPIVISGKVDSKSVTSKIIKQSKDGFDVQVSINVPIFNVSASELSICETKTSKKRCGAGLKATVKKLNISTKGNPARVSAVFRVSTKNSVAKVKLLGISTNLKAKNGPSLVIDFGQVMIPPIYISINNQETELDTSSLRNEIIKRKAFLSQALVEFAADFMSSDMAEMVNAYLLNESVRTNVTVLNYERKQFSSLEDFIDNDDFDDFAPEDKTPVIHPTYKLQPENLVREVKKKSLKDYIDEEEVPWMVVDNTYVAKPNIMPLKKEFDIKLVIAEIAKIIYSAQVKLGLGKMTTPSSKDIELGGSVEFLLNKKSMKVVNQLGNRSRELPDLNLNVYRKNDVVIAIAEPVLNAALDLAGQNKIFQTILDKFVNEPGFYINNIKIHFASNDHQNLSRVYVVANAEVRLKEVKSTSPWNLITNRIGVWLERNNNNSVIYFPLQFEVIPTISYDKEGRLILKAKVNSPFDSEKIIRNDYDYGTNILEATKAVRTTIIEKIQKGLGYAPDEEKEKVKKGSGQKNSSEYEIDLSKFLNNSGVKFKPTLLTVWDSSYLVLGAEIKDIVFDELKLQPKPKAKVKK